MSDGGWALPPVPALGTEAEGKPKGLRAEGAAGTTGGAAALTASVTCMEPSVSPRTLCFPRSSCLHGGVYAKSPAPA